ncbi:MAG: DUF1800 domain-containing protein [Planctomycetota bacterium]
MSHNRTRWLHVPLAVIAPLALPAAAAPAPQIQDAPPTRAAASVDDAVLFLNRATFGASPDDIEFVVRAGYARWIQRQVGMQPSLMLPTLRGMGCAPDQPGYSFFTCPNYEPDAHIERRLQLWWEHAIAADDQLRQRVAFALSEIFVVSDRDALLGEFPSTMADYYDTLVRGAFGTYRDLLEEVTLHPAMGTYLSMAKNRQEDLVLGTRPDENFAREVMQLFSIGLSMLDDSGELILDANGEPIPTYDQDVIKDMARALTGWTYRADYPPSASLLQFLYTYPRIGRMVSWTAFHDPLDKTIVGGAYVPAFLYPEEDLALVLDALDAHPNVAPFMSKQLIQRLVTSNPSPEYVARISAVWNDDGNGVRGNLLAVVAAILLDGEGLRGHEAWPDTFGKLREPILRVTGVWRAFEAAPTVGFTPFIAEEYLGQRAQGSPSVFNFFSPTYTTGALAAQGLVAPELQITTHSRITRTANLLTYYIYEGNTTLADPAYTEPRFSIEPARLQAGYPPALVEFLDERLCGGTMSDATRQILEDHLLWVPHNVPGYPPGLFRALEGVNLVAISPDYAIQR